MVASVGNSEWVVAIALAAFQKLLDRAVQLSCKPDCIQSFFLVVVVDLQPSYGLEDEDLVIWDDPVPYWD